MSDTYFDEQGFELDHYALHDRYDDMLDEVFGEVLLAGCSYSHARTLKAVDPIAYRCGFSDWLNGELGETLFESDPTVELEFEEGDEVRVIDLDVVGTINSVDEDDRQLPYQVRFADGNCNWYDASEIEAAEQASPFRVVALIIVDLEG